MSVTNPIAGSITGNAATATKLVASKNINGVAFDGSTDITVTADAGTLTGTTLATNVVSSSLTSVGTLNNLSVTNPIAGSITGNAATATKLVASKNINGVAFDGSTDITVTADAGTLTGNTLASNVVNSNLTSVGTLSNLSVVGASTLASANITGNANISGTTTATNINASGNINVTGDTTLGGKLNVKEIVDSSTNRINNNPGGYNEITVNSMSGRFRFPSSLTNPNPTPSPAIPINTLRVKNSYVNSNSIIICNIASDNNNSNAILSVTSNTNYFEVKLEFPQDLNINFLVIN